MVDPELLLPDGLLEATLQPQALWDLGLHALVEKLVSALALLLGPVQGQIGVVQ